MERKIGEIFEYNGEWYQCLAAIDGCKECSFRTQDYCTRYSECFSSVRSDEISVIFKKLEKIGEPYTDYFQRYKCYQKPAISKETIIHWADDISVSIEIKQNKEDIPEFDEVIDRYLSGENKLNLKPFDLEKAKTGKSVCTRDGRKARIICFDRISSDDYYKIVACVTAFDKDFEEVLFYGIDGYIVDSQNPKDEDLMILPEKKEGWINLYKWSTPIYKSEEEAKACVGSEKMNEYIASVKVQWEE